MCKVLRIGIFVALVLAVQVAAAENPPTPDPAREQTPAAGKEAGVTNVIFTKLSAAVDEWIEANLAGDERRVKQLEATIMDLLGKDITATDRHIRNAEAETYRSAKADGRTTPTGDTQGDDSLYVQQRLDRIREAKEILRVKERLVSIIVRAPTFSNKYRLLGDYLEVLRRETGTVRVNLAEDSENNKELSKDRVERQ